MQLSDNLLPLDAERLERHRKFDKELIEFNEILVEPPIRFMPTFLGLILGIVSQWIPILRVTIKGGIFRI